MKKLLLFIFVAIAGQVKGQDELINNAYYYNGELLSLPVNYNAFLVGSYISVDLGYVFQQYGYAIDTVDSCTHSDEKDSNMHYQLVKINNSALNLSAYNTLRANLKNTDHLIVEPVLGDEEDFRPLTPYFYIKLKDEGDTTILDSFANSVNVPIVRHVASMPLWCVLKSDSSSLGNSLEMANYFYQSGLFEDIDPGFTFKFAPATCVTDYNFTTGDQWNLYNYTNQNLDIKDFSKLP